MDLNDFGWFALGTVFGVLLTVIVAYLYVNVTITFH